MICFKAPLNNICSSFNVKLLLRSLVLLALLWSPAAVQAAPVDFQGVRLKLPENASLTWIVKNGKVNGLDASVALIDLPTTSSTVTPLFENIMKNYGHYQHSSEGGSEFYSQRRDNWFLTFEIKDGGAGTRVNVMVTEFNSRKLDKSLKSFKVPAQFEVVQVNRDDIAENASLLSKSTVELAINQLHSSLSRAGWKKQSADRLSGTYGQQLRYQKRSKVMELIVVANYVGEYATATYLSVPQ